MKAALLNAICIALTSLSGLVVLLNGSVWAFWPHINMEQLGIGTTQTIGLNMLKRDIGCSLLSLGIMPGGWP